MNSAEVPDAGKLPSEHRNVENVQAFLRLLEEKDIDRWAELWDANAEQFYPYGTEMFPEHLVGKTAIYDRWKALPDMFESLRFPVQEVWSDGDTVIAKFEGELIRHDGVRYENNYICVFKFTDEGKLSAYWEYFDPIPAGIAFDLLEVTYRRP
jgi:ketosteroid isomerase-like protein